MATADERNFRSSYYEKVGFRNVEEKKSLEILLKEKSLDKIKLNHFCLRFPVPGIHRSYLWKLLLGVLPMQVGCHDYVWSCREQSFNDLARQMRVLKLVCPSASHSIVVMWLLETSAVPTGCTDPLKLNPIYENFAKLAAMMMEFFDNDIEVYWVSKGFFNFLTRLVIEMPKLTECTYSLLEKEDCELYAHMLDRELLANLPLFDWYTSMFAVVLSESSLCKIWDKMVGGSYKILIFVAVALCVSLKKQIVSCETLNHLVSLFENVSEDASEVVVNKALDLWQQHGNLINLGLEFSIKHNPTALWAAQQTASMPNLSSVVGQGPAGFLERQVTVPDVNLMKDIYLWEYQEPEKRFEENCDVADANKVNSPELGPSKTSAQNPAASTLEQKPAARPKTRKTTIWTVADEKNRAVYKQHAKMRDQALRSFKFDPVPVSQSGDYDETWTHCQGNQQSGVHFIPGLTTNREDEVVQIEQTDGHENEADGLCRKHLRILLPVGIVGTIVAVFMVIIWYLILNW